jgi:hypothetical protein
MESFGVQDMPVKSALSQIRKRIHFTFFEELFKELLQSFESKRSTLNGLRIYAVDGVQLLLPRTADLVKHGFSGRAVSKYRDTYYPRIYLTHAYDVLSGVTKDLRYHSVLNEIADAVEMVAGFEKSSLTLYDRLYVCKKLVLAHFERSNYFLFRCRRAGVPKAISNFFSSHKKVASFTWPGTKVRVYLIKVKNAKTGKHDVFATNLPKSWQIEEKIKDLYALRWEVETSFRDLTETLKIEQWHSKSLNGILQELYVSFWLWNYSKIHAHFRDKKTEILLDPTYTKPNYKLILALIVRLFPKILKRTRGVLKDLETLMNLSTEHRKRRSRHYKRELKTPRSPYPYNNTGWTWDFK